MQTPTTYATTDTTCARCATPIHDGDIVTTDGTHVDWVCDVLANPATGPSDFEIEFEPFGPAWHNENRRAR